MKKRNMILIVDDMEINRAILCQIFENEYTLLEAENGEQALLLLAQHHHQIAAMLLDLVMPVMDGFTVLTELHRRGMNDFPVIVITAENSAENEVQSFDLGASDIIKKPFEPHVVRRRVQNVIELNLRRLNQQELIDEQAKKLRESNAVMVDALSAIIEYRSMETGQHIQRIRMFTQVLLEDVAQSYPEFGLDERKIGIIVSASSMHDIGKIAIPDNILNKPGRLTDEEYEIMKTHAVKGCEMLETLDRMSDKEYLRYAYNICRHHHERWDGRGYPDGLKGDSIPVCAQVVGIADCYDALTTDRVYKKAIPQEKAFNMILNGECGVFSPKLLECLKNVRLVFARLSREYADGKRQHPTVLQPRLPVLAQQENALDTLQMGQMKYFTLLRYVNSTVMEVDLNTGVYHVVYMAGPDFEALRSGDAFMETIRRFAEEAVHPDDCKILLETLDDYVHNFLSNGFMKRSRKYRVFRRDTGAYHWCRATLLRIDTNNPIEHKALVVWRWAGSEQNKSAIPHLPLEKDVLMNNLLGGVQICLYDQWFTMPQISASLKKLLGYSDQELHERFHNRFIELVYPPDRPMLLRRINEQFRAGTLADAEYRLTAKDGGLVWILDKSRLFTGLDGTERILCVLVDITQSKQAQEELRRSLERHKIIMEHTNDIIFEWDAATDFMDYSNNLKKKFGFDPIRENVSALLPQSAHIHPEDRPALMRIFQEITRGQPYAQIEFRMADAKGTYRWCKIRAVAQLNDAGKIYKIVGVITDIDEERRTVQALRMKADHDSLTHLYNQSTGRRLIRKYLNSCGPEARSAMLILDIDNFKVVNDTYGHMFGDTVLQKIATDLCRLFRENDIISRVGGDEFLIFMQNIPNLEIVKNRAQQVNNDLRTLFRADSADFTPSCSIGVACFPQDGQDYDTLFQCGDTALYTAKSQGKNKYCFFDRNNMAKLREAYRAQPAAGTQIDSEAASAFPEK